MTVNNLINILASVTLLEMMITIGLGVTFSDVVQVARDRGVVTRAALANYVCVPIAVVGLLLLFHARPMVAAGFLIAAVCPGAPYGPPLTAIARGNVAVAVGLMVVLAGSSAIIAPLLLRLLLPLMAENEPLKVDAGKIITTLLTTQLLPLCAGLFVRQRRPALAERLARPGKLLSILLNLLTVGVILVAQFQMLAAIRARGYVGMLALVAATVAAGWLVGGPGRDNRKNMAVTTSVRNMGVSLVIVTGSFPGTPAVTAATAYALFQTIVMAMVALVWGRLAPAAEHVARLGDQVATAPDNVLR